jgi:hypothetical protein
MGGNLAITIREPNGKEHRMNRWTNPLPFFVNNVRLCDKDPDYLADYLKSWYNMLADWEKSEHGSLKCELPMTACYAPYPFLAPFSYGLVVIDMMKHVILDLNGYSELGTLHDGGVRTELQHPASHGLGPKDVPCENLKEFAERGQVVSFNQYKKKPLDWRGKTFEEIKAFILDPANANKFGKIVLDMSPFKVERFEESPEGALKLRERVLELGFKLSKKEEKLWANWRNEDFGTPIKLTAYVADSDMRMKPRPAR